MSKLYLNLDCDTVVIPFLKRICDRPEFCEEMLYPMVDMYSALGVTDLVINNFCQISFSPSSVITDIVAKYNATEEKGIKVDYSETYAFAHRFFNELKTDYYSVWFERCRQRGIHPWISVRMNDCHYPFDKTSEIRSGLHFEAEEKGFMLGDDYGYYRICLDYKVKEIRDTMLSYIRERIMRYDVYGIELDFQRECRCFKYLTEDMEECRGIMTSFVRDVKNILTEARTAHGHEIKLMVRLPRDIEQCRLLGFDPKVWAREGIVDIIVPSPRFSSNDSGIPVSEWIEKCRGVQITAGIETLLSFKKNIAISSAEMCTGLAAGFMADGSNGIYLFNFFCDPDDIVKPQIHPYVRNCKTMLAVSDSEKIYDNPMRFAVLEQEDEYIEGLRYAPLPINLKSSEGSIDIITGKIPEGKAVSLIVGYKKEMPRIFVNGTEYKKGADVDLTLIPGIGVQPENYVDEEMVCVRFALDRKDISGMRQKVSFSSEAFSEIHWVEIDVL